MAEHAELLSQLAPSTRSRAMAVVLAGTGARGTSGDEGPAAGAALSDPNGVAVDAAGNVYIAGGNRIRRIGRDGRITTVAVSGISPNCPACPQFSGDNGPAG
jgi:DNA-binding beta-propeller fold protein YncE